MDLTSFQKNNSFKKNKNKFVNFFDRLKKFFSLSSKYEDNDKNLVYSLAASKIPRREQLKHLFKLLNPRERGLLKISVLVFVVCGFYLLFNFYQNNLITIAKAGGTYREGVAAYPQNINPLYASNRDLDADLSRLIYSSLFYYDSEGVLKPDLVEDWHASEDGKEYQMTLRENVKWHNGNILNVDDLIFTFNLMKNPEFRSPLRASLNGIIIERIDDNSIKFILVEPYADFLHLLNFGIMPRFAWENISPEMASMSILNIEPIGSGPYQYSSMIKSKGGELKEYHLSRNPEYYASKPYIEEIIFKFYPSYNELVSALNANEVDGVSFLPSDFRAEILSKQSINFHKLRLPVINLVFLNQEKNNLLKDQKLRQALDWSINKETLIKDTLNGDAFMVNGPILAPEFSLGGQEENFDIEKASNNLVEAGFKKISTTESDFNNEDDLDEDLKIIKKFAEINNLSLTGDWNLKDKQVLSIKLSFSETIDEQVAFKIQEDWQSLGVKVILEKLSPDVLKEKIKNLDFEALLFGQFVGLDPDITVFWHSTQVGKQGLNLAQYKNSDLDILLTEARKIINKEERIAKYREIQEIIKADNPVIFLYSPSYTYIQSKKVRGFSGSFINTASDRLAGISNWYVRVKKRFAW